MIIIAREALLGMSGLTFVVEMVSGDFLGSSDFEICLVVYSVFY